MFVKNLDLTKITLMQRKKAQNVITNRQICILPLFDENRAPNITSFSRAKIHPSRTQSTKATTREKKTIKDKEWNGSSTMRVPDSCTKWKWNCGSLYKPEAKNVIFGKIVYRPCQHFSRQIRTKLLSLERKNHCNNKAFVEKCTLKSNNA